MSVVFQKTSALTDVKMHYCPGCTHGIIHRLVAECLEELEEDKNAIIAVPVGCSVLADVYFNVDTIQCAHGRAPATATGIKRVHPDKMVLTYQGDGDLASIGTAEIVHAASRGEKFTTIFVNNGIYGMTGGQMAPTTLPGMRSTTSKAGRDVAINGNPMRMSEMLAVLDGPAYIERVGVVTPGQVTQAKKAIKKALEIQKQGLGFSMIEVMSTCPTNWGMTPVQSLEHVKEKMIPFYPLGVYKDVTKEGGN